MQLLVLSEVVVLIWGREVNARKITPMVLKTLLAICTWVTARLPALMVRLVHHGLQGVQLRPGKARPFPWKFTCQ